MALTKLQKMVIETIKIDMMIISDEQAEIIQDCLKINEIDDAKKLIAIRNDVVMYLGDKFNETDDLQYMINISGITMVIDQKLFALGAI